MAPNGAATYVGYDRGSGGTFPDLASGPGGAVYADTGSAIVRVERDKLTTKFVFNKKLRGEYFSLSNFAFGSHGVMYADDLAGGLGFEAHQQLVTIMGAHLRVLWQESNAASK